ncbi:MAG: 16S rRNA (guanine(527)-N(7))-methyltransferase RsmG [Acutalibacteraceae bacterium]
MIDFELMKEKAATFGVNLSENQLKMLDIYADMLVDWNTRMNLTGITDSEGIMTRHFEDSLTMLSAVEIPEGARVIDIGTGAGFPGMVLKIARPDIDLTLLDSLNKRIVFLEAVAQSVGIKVNTLHLRAEEGGKNALHREKYDVACARAVANLRELAEYCLPYVKVGGKFVSMKGPDVQEEVVSAKPGIGTLGGRLSEVKTLKISDGSGRSVIVIDKVKNTPPQFPRNSGKISKKPL